MTVLQSARPGFRNNETNSQSMERVPPEIVILKGSVGSSGGTDVNVYCQDKLRSPSDGKMQTVVEVSEESLSKILGGPIVSEKVVDESMRVDAVADVEEGGQE